MSDNLNLRMITNVVQEILEKDLTLGENSIK